METGQVFKLPSEEKIRGRLLAIGGTNHLQERFFPLLTKYAGKEATAQEVREWLVGAMGEYMQTLPKNALRNIRRLMYINAGRFVDAMVEEKAVAAEIKAHFRVMSAKM